MEGEKKKQPRVKAQTAHVSYLAQTAHVSYLQASFMPFLHLFVQ